jgi:hypothetical protein
MSYCIRDPKSSWKQPACTCIRWYMMTIISKNMLNHKDLELEVWIADWPVGHPGHGNSTQIDRVPGCIWAMMLDPIPFPGSWMLHVGAQMGFDSERCSWWTCSPFSHSSLILEGRRHREAATSLQTSIPQAIKQQHRNTKPNNGQQDAQKGHSNRILAPTWAT